MGAGALLAVVPFVAGPFLRTSVDALESISAGAFVGSLIGVLVLVAAPILLLGTVAPYAIRLSVKRIEEAGRVSGRLYAISTVGSLAGVFLAALVLIPLLGTRRTFLFFALSLGVVGALGLRRRFAVAPVAIGALILLPVGTVKAGKGERVIWERETPYQYARVVQAVDGERRLELNEGRAVHSVYRPGRWLTGDYWDEFLVLPFATRPRPPRSVAILGSAAGTTVRAQGHYFPRTSIDAVEIDRSLIDVGRRLFDMRAPRLRTHAQDARPWLHKTDRRFDAIYVDAYRQPYIPFYLATREFFSLVRDRLTPGGVVLVNVGHPEGSGRLERVLATTMGDVFTTVLTDPAEPTNSVLIATDAPVGPGRLRAAERTMPVQLRPVAELAARRLRPARRGGMVYTDDRAPVEWLIDTSIVKYAADGGG